jgi:hypothetical protein
MEDEALDSPQENYSLSAPLIQIKKSIAKGS